MSEIIPYHIKRSARARHARLRITADKKLTVTLPLRAPLSLAETLVVQHKNWIIKHLMRTRPERITLPSGRADYLQNKHPALSLVRERLNFFNQPRGCSVRLPV
jgi:predicted metal-dependent hydrolase